MPIRLRIVRRRIVRAAAWPRGGRSAICKRQRGPGQVGQRRLSQLHSTGQVPALLERHEIDPAGSKKQGSALAGALAESTLAQRLHRDGWTGGGPSAEKHMQSVFISQTGLFCLDTRQAGADQAPPADKGWYCTWYMVRRGGGARRRARRVLLDGALRHPQQAEAAVVVAQVLAPDAAAALCPSAGGPGWGVRLTAVVGSVAVAVAHVVARVSGRLAVWEAGGGVAGWQGAVTGRGPALVFGSGRREFERGNNEEKKATLLGISVQAESADRHPPALADGAGSRIRTDNGPQRRGVA